MISKNPGSKELKRLYIDEIFSTTKIAGIYDVSQPTAVKWLKESGVIIRTSSETGLLRKGVTRPPGKELRKLYVDEGVSTTKIAKMYYISISTAIDWLREDGVKIRSSAETRLLSRRVIKPSGKDLRRLYVDERMNSTEIAEMCNTNPVTVRGWLIKEDIRIRSRSEAKLPRGVTRPSGEELERLYVDERMSSTEIAEMYGTGISTISKWLIKEGIKTRNASEAKLPRGVTRPSGEELERLYVDERMSINNIAEMYGVNKTTAWGWLKGAGVKIRPSNSPKRNSGQFIQETQEALSIASLASVTENTGDIARILIQAWPDSFPPEQELAKMLPGIVKNTGEALRPFNLERAAYHTTEWATLPTEVKYCLEDLVYSIVLDQYQKPFNDDPEATIDELGKFIHRKSEVQGLAKRVLSHYKEVYAFSIPGHGKMKGAA